MLYNFQTALHAKTNNLHLPAVIGHRGAAEIAPENTLSSLRLAHSEGSRMVEIDVRLSADGVPILLHDATLDRTTSGQGFVTEWTANALHALDAGSWKSQHFLGESVPTLHDVITLCMELDLELNIEIKPNDQQDSQTARAIAAVLQASWPDTLALPLISSFSLSSLITMRDEAAFLPRGILFERRPDNWKELAHSVGAKSIHLWERTETPESIADIASDDFLILVYTVNDIAAAKIWLDSGANAVISDCPGRILQNLTTHQTVDK